VWAAWLRLGALEGRLKGKSLIAQVRGSSGCALVGSVIIKCVGELWAVGCVVQKRGLGGQRIGGICADKVCVGRLRGSDKVCWSSALKGGPRGGLKDKLRGAK